MQHNSAATHGLFSREQALTHMAEAGTPMVDTKNHFILGEGDFVLSVSEGQFPGKHTSFYDLFRIENGEITEHWDTVEKIPNKSKWRNDNGKFFSCLENKSYKPTSTFIVFQ